MKLLNAFNVEKGRGLVLEFLRLIPVVWSKFTALTWVKGLKDSTGLLAS